MANSYNGVINTEGEFVTVASVADFTFTEGKKYLLYVSKNVYFKISNAVIPQSEGKVNYTATSDDLYIKTTGDCTLSILEG